MFVSSNLIRFYINQLILFVNYQFRSWIFIFAFQSLHKNEMRHGVCKCHDTTIQIYWFSFEILVKHRKIMNCLYVHRIIIYKTVLIIIIKFCRICISSIIDIKKNREIFSLHFTGTNKDCKSIQQPNLKWLSIKGVKDSLTNMKIWYLIDVCAHPIKSKFCKNNAWKQLKMLVVTKEILFCVGNGWIFQLQCFIIL